MNIPNFLAIQSPFVLPNYDALTGFLNRETMIGELFRETDRIQRMGGVLCFMLIEIDHFAEIRTEYGAENADYLLRYIAGRLRRYLRTYDLIARQEENEFLIALPGCIPADALLLANRTRTVLFHHPVEVSTKSVTLSASFGISQSKGRSPLTVLLEAQHALNEALLAGGDCVFVFGESCT
jgi:two-component system, cell cycle response regulator